MRGSRWFIIGIVLFLLIMFVVEYHLPKKFVWNPTFGQHDHQPLGGAVFDDVLKKYTSSWMFKKVKTKEFGSLFEITYTVVMKNENQKKFIDELRCRNGNLGVVLSVPQEEK